MRQDLLLQYLQSEQAGRIEYTLTLDGSDRALMRVFGLRGVYRVSLASGETDREV